MSATRLRPREIETNQWKYLGVWDQTHKRQSKHKLSRWPRPWVTETQGSRRLKSETKMEALLHWPKKHQNWRKSRVSNPGHLTCLRHTRYQTLGNESNSRSHHMEAATLHHLETLKNIWGPIPDLLNENLHFHPDPQVI